MKLRYFLLSAVVAATAHAATVHKADFGKLADGTAVALFTLSNSKGMEASVATYGGALVSLKTPDRTGKMGDVVLGYDSAAEYQKGKAYFGALIGRYGNRIGHAQFTLDGKTYHVP